jgi:hypothetical protein
MKPRVFRTMNVGGARQRVDLYCENGECVIDAKICKIRPSEEYPETFAAWAGMMKEFKNFIARVKDSVQDKGAIEALNTFSREGYAHLLYMLRDELKSR